MAVFFSWSCPMFYPDIPVTLYGRLLLLVLSYVLPRHPSHSVWPSSSLGPVLCSTQTSQSLCVAVFFSRSCPMFYPDIPVTLYGRLLLLVLSYVLPRHPSHSVWPSSSLGPVLCSTQTSQSLCVAVFFSWSCPMFYPDIPVTLCSRLLLLVLSYVLPRHPSHSVWPSSSLGPVLCSTQTSQSLCMAVFFSWSCPMFYPDIPVTLCGRLLPLVLSYVLPRHPSHSVWPSSSLGPVLCSTQTSQSLCVAVFFSRSCPMFYPDIPVTLCRRLLLSVLSYVLPRHPSHSV